MKIVKLDNENEIVIFEIVFGIVHGRPYKRFWKIPPYTSSNYSSLEFKSHILILRNTNYNIYACSIIHVICVCYRKLVLWEFHTITNNNP